MNDDFYVGYEPHMPSSLARPIRAVSAVLLVLSLALAGILLAGQASFADGFFDYGNARWFEGRIVEHPYPALEVSTGTRHLQWYWLVGPGKHGAASLVRGLEGRRVRLSGSLIERDGERMIEVVPASVSATSAEPSTVSTLHTIGPTTVVGEIVDSKCHLGVMKPGEGPTHRDCAVRCLLGQVPPMLVIREGGFTRRIPLMTPDDEAFRAAVASLAGRPVRVRGTLVEREGRQFLSTSVPGIDVADRW